MSAIDTVLAQLAAFNAHHLDDFVGTYSADAVITGVGDTPLVGTDAIRDHYRPRFENSDLRCEIESTVLFGDRWVIAREYVISGGVPTETIAMFDVVDGKISRASMLKA